MPDYYDTLILGTTQGRKITIDNKTLVDLINKGLSSVKMAKDLNISYTTVNRYVKTRCPEYWDQLKENGKKHKVRRKLC